VEGKVSAENVEVVRACWDAWATSGLDDYVSYMDPDVDWRAIEGAPDDHGPIEGRAALRAYIADWDEMFENLANVPLEIVDAGGDTVVSVQRVSGTAKLSGVPAELVYGVVYTVRDGLIASGREYATREQALEAAGVTAA
jgi:ketosteroid isomerase-like protein